jgi:xanthine dehydrogenase accessory factor
MSDESFFRLLTEQLQERGRLALATVVEVKGSGPSRVGRRFLLFEDGTFSGTIGGGPFEALVVADAGALFRDDGPDRLIKWYDFFEREILSSGPEREPTNMICGGSARVFVELLKAAPALFILGGGHVGLALARLAPALGYEVTVADDRREYSAPERFPGGVQAFQTNRHYDLAPEALRPGRDRYIVIVTRCWETDLAALRPWLSAEAPPAKYVGLIGSVRKVRGVFEKLREEGVSEERLQRVHAPIGVAVGAVTPEEIAVSILAEMTAVRRGELPDRDGSARRAAAKPMPAREDR